MTQFVVGCVPYLNALPLLWKWQRLGSESPIQVVYDVPSRLPSRLDSGECLAIQVSSFELFAHPGRILIPGNGIGSRGPVDSVRLFSKVPFRAIQSLALDQSSMTSNALSRILLAEVYKTWPSCEPCPPNLGAMLARHDAAVLIGDLGMAADGTDLHVLDLGEAWTEHTGLPFVWAGWIANADCPIELQTLLSEPLSYTDLEWDAMCRHGHELTGWPLDTVTNYLQFTMRYALDDQAMAGLASYGTKLAEHGLIAKHQATV